MGDVGGSRPPRASAAQEWAGSVAVLGWLVPGLGCERVNLYFKIPQAPVTVGQPFPSVALFLQPYPGEERQKCLREGLGPAPAERWDRSLPPPGRGEPPRWPASSPLGRRRFPGLPALVSPGRGGTRPLGCLAGARWPCTLLCKAPGTWQDQNRMEVLPLLTGRKLASLARGVPSPCVSSLLPEAHQQ